MRIAITGSTGTIGSALVAALEADGHVVTRIVRPGSGSLSGSGIITWDPERGSIDEAGLAGHDAFINLAGEPVAGIWTAEKKRRIRESRVKGTALLASAIAGLEPRPSVFISASAIGFYGNRPPGEPLDESSPRGRGFLADTAEAWEAAADPARRSAIRVVHPRMGVVLTRDGGALGKTLPLFKGGLGGKVGSGRQVWSWVTLDDVVGAIRFMLTDPALDGPVNVVAPQPVTNLAYTRTLGRVLHRPTVFGVPGFVLKMVMGQMAQELLLDGARVVPRKLREAGYEFRHKELEAALRAVLAR